MAAFEVPLATADDHKDFLNLMREEAKTSGFHVDAASADELKTLSEVSPMTFSAAVWVGKDDKEAVASAMDFQDHLGLVWLTFSRGSKPERVLRFREALMQRVTARWPGTTPLPIMQTGAIPLRDDLIRTPNGYEVKTSAKLKYQVQTSGVRSH